MAANRILAFLDLSTAPSVRLLSIGWAELVAHAWDHAQAESDFWTCYRNSRGGTQLTTRDGTISMAAETAYLIPPNTAFARANATDTGHLYLYFDCTGIDALSLPTVIRVPGSADERWLATLSRAPRQPTPAVTMRLSAMLLTALQPYAGAAAVTPGHDGAAVAPALVAMRKDPAHPWSLAELAGLCGCAPATFGRRFNSALGCSPVQWLRAHRARLAAHRIATTELSLESIARAVGFGSRPYLSRVFHAVLGIGPGEYRQALRNGKHPLGPRERWG